MTGESLQTFGGVFLFIFLTQQKPPLAVFVVSKFLPSLSSTRVISKRA